MHSFRVKLLLVLTLAALAPLQASLQAQIRGGGRAPQRSTGVSGWWFSAGGGAAGLGPVLDGRSGSEWDFSGDPRWQMRGSLEKSFQPTTSIGVAVNYGTVDLQYRPLAGVGVLDPSPEAPPSVTACRSAECTAQVDLAGVQAVIHGGGGREGFHQVVEASGGVNLFRNMRVKSDQELLPVEQAVDINIGIGYGLAYAFSSQTNISIVQDIGIAWHDGTGLPEGQGRTYRTRNTRVVLRYGFGSLRR